MRKKSSDFFYTQNKTLSCWVKNINTIMIFDEFVNKILREAITSIPSKVSPLPKQIPQKKISDISAYPASQTTQQTPPPAGQQPKQDSPAAVDALTKQLSDSEKKEDDRAKKEHDDFAKLIATLTATAAQQKNNQNTTTQPTTQSNVPQQTTNPQDIIANLKKMAWY